MKLNEFNPTIEIEAGENPGLRCSFQEFCAANEFESEYIKTVGETLATGLPFTDGGGAAPIWTIRAVTTDATAEEIENEKYLFVHGWQYGFTGDGWRWANPNVGLGIFWTLAAAYEVETQSRVRARVDQSADDFAEYMSHSDADPGL